MTVSSNVKKLAAVAVLGALSLAGASTAMAADPESTFNPDLKGSLTIHKHFGNEGAAGNGKEATIDTATNPPLSGVKFKIEKVDSAELTVDGTKKNVDIDLTKNTGWEAAQKLSKEPGAKVTTSGTQQGETNEQGTLVFSNLAVGLYKVTETDNTNAKKNGTGAAVKVKKADPFFVSIPLTTPEGNGYLYNVHVYPKNQEFQLNKKGELVTSLTEAEKADMANAPKPGQVMRYTVTSTLPALAEGKHYEKYNMSDKPSEHFDLSTFKVEKVEAVTGDDDAQPKVLTAKTDYTVENKGAYVVVSATKDGLKALEAAQPAKTQVRYTYTIKIKDDFKAGELTNKASVAPSNEYDDDPDKNDNNTENKEKFVQFQILKKDADSSVTTPLKGAKFDLYACDANGKFLDDKGKEVAKENALPIVKDATTGEDSKTVSARIPVTGENGPAKICAVETQAPAGYTLPSTPFIFDVKDKADSETNPVIQEIKNVQNNAGFKLPLTGAQSLVILSVAGVALIAGAIIVTTRSRKNA